MARTWAFQTRTWDRAGYTALEGSASFDGRHAKLFLVVGPQHVSLDIQSLRGLTDRLSALFSPALGPPATGPTVVNIGELMDSLDEAPVNATWSFPPSQREEVLRDLERLLCGGRGSTPSGEGIVTAT
jgi:hypothetical protein